MPDFGASILAGALLLTAAAPLGAERRAAFFVFDCPPAKERFTIKLTDPKRIREARRMIARGDRRKHVAGIVVKQPAPYNRPWSFHLDPKSIRFVGVSIEVGDASIRYVEQHLDEVGGEFLPGNRWTPWGSRLLFERR